MISNRLCHCWVVYARKPMMSLWLRWRRLEQSMALSREPWFKIRMRWQRKARFVRHLSWMCGMYQTPRRGQGGTAARHVVGLQRPMTVIWPG